MSGSQFPLADTVFEGSVLTNSDEVIGSVLTLLRQVASGELPPTFPLAETLFQYGYLAGYDAGHIAGFQSSAEDWDV